jgi:hypothetical protein
MGGVINIITSTPKKLEANAHLGCGSDDTIGYGAYVGNQFFNRLSMMLGFEGEETGGYPTALVTRSIYGGGGTLFGGYPMKSTSKTRKWVVGDKGNVFYTNDGGTTWNPVDIGSTHSLKAMARRSNAVFYASGSSTSIYKVVRENYIAHSNIKINELYVGGPANAGYFFKDQYVELYNAGTQTEYLDGKIICRLSRNITKVTYIFQFPGNGTDYPIQPGEYKVCAQSAVNWKEQYPTSIDLSHADFEFYNPANASDPDNPDVPNIVNLYEGRRTDFMLSLTSDEVILATGADIDYTDGIDIETVIDGVEYDGKATSQKTLDPRIDAGHFCCAVKYQGKSIERIAPGYDTNNSSVDFRLIDYPTPGMTMPVELASFTAHVSENGVKLSWVTASEVTVCFLKFRHVKISEKLSYY